MLSQDLAFDLKITPIPQNKLKNHSFLEQQPLWVKDKHHFISPHKIATCKRYIFYKYGKMLGMQTIRYLSIYQNYLFYYQENSGGVSKGFCNLQNRYVQFHNTTTQKYVLVISNIKSTSIFYFDNMDFWNQWKKQIIQYTIRTNYQQQYKEKYILGQGSFSTVVAVTSNDGKVYAAKKIAKFDRNHKGTKKIVIEQRKILQVLKDCKYISKLVQFYEENNQYILILEYLQGKNLFDFLTENKDTPIYTIKKILNEILNGLKILHQNNIIHRDIKPQNILIGQDFNCKIIDFGLSLRTDDKIEKCRFGKCGTVGYMAPQVINNKSLALPYNNKCDLFSLGIIAHMLLVGINPLKGKHYQETYDLNLQCKIFLNKTKIISKYGVQCLAFIQKLLQVNPKSRYSACNALDSLFLRNEQKDEYFTQQNSTADDKRKLSEQYFPSK